MEYYIYMLVSLVLMISMLKLVFSELEGRMAKKQTNIRWYLFYNKGFSYKRNNTIIFLSIFCYVFSTTESFFSLIWVAEIIWFVAIGVVADGISQLVSSIYIKNRFRFDIRGAIALEAEIKTAFEKEDNDLFYEGEAKYNSIEIVKEHLKEDTRLAISSVDGGEFATKFDNLPPITYVVEGQYEAACERLNDYGVKVTKWTDDNRMPFKDERIDVIVNEYVNYDKFEIFRVLKPEGHFIVEQVGSDNYKEIISMFVPFRVKGTWDKENCSKTLREIGFEVVGGYEDFNHIRFKSLAAFITFMRKTSPERVERHELYINFYAHVLKEIQKNDFFDLSTHKFMVIVKKS